jgi:phosphohistidine phosphatase SixA
MKLLVIRIIVSALLLSTWVTAQQNNRTIFLVRHAERATSAADTPLSPAGVKRAECLARMLKDAGIKQIYVTDTKRAQQTAEPLAKSLGVKPTVIPAMDSSTLVRNLFYGRDNAVVVGHSDTLPVLIQRLQAGSVPAISDSEYDKMFVVSMVESSAAPVATVRYCDCGAPAASAPANKPATKMPPPAKP